MPQSQFSKINYEIRNNISFLVWLNFNSRQKILGNGELNPGPPRAAFKLDRRKF